MRFALLLLGILLIGCTQAPQPPANQSVGTPFKLHVNQSQIANGFNITFTGVAEDSRCPSDVTCIRAGEAKVWIRVAKLPNPKGTIYNTEFEMVRGPGDAISEKDLSDYSGKYTLKLLEVDPYPKSTDQNRDYVVTLELD